MRQKNTHTKGLFSALKRRAEISVSVVLSLLIFAGPVEASTWKPTALVNTEAFHSIDDTDAGADVVLKFGDTLAKTLTYDRSAARFEFNDQVYVNGNLMTMGTMSGAHVHAEKSLTSSGTILSVGNITGRGTLSGQTVTGGGGVSQLSKTGLLIDSASTAALARIGNITGAPGGNTMNIGANYIQTIEQVELDESSLHLNPNGGNVGINKPTSATVKSALDVVGTISGTTVSISSSINGAGLTSCSNATTSKLLYDSATGRFSCGTDQTGGGGSAFSTGNVLTIGNQKYVSKQGDTMTGALAVNIQGGTLGSIGINAVNTISGAIIHAQKHLTSSGGVLSFGDIVTKGALRTSGYGLAFASGAVMNEWSGFNSMINIQNGHLGTNGIARLSNEGNLTNIGSIQSGEIHATAGLIFSQTDRTDYATGSSPRRALIRDVNGDGKQDILVSNSTTTTFSAFINNGNGTFAAKVDYTTGSNPYSIATADFNGDGKLDVVAGDNGAATVSVLLNRGNGTFLNRTAYAAGSVVHDVATGDINGDGKPDIVSANYNADSVSVFINNGAGRFAAKADFTTNSNPTGVSIADFNGDGKMDIATTNLLGGNISVLINTGNGTFATKVDYTTGGSPFAIAVGDLNDDGETDIATANFGGTNTSVFLNNGNGTFATKVDYSAGSTPRGIGIGDINGDGKLDIAISNGGAGTVSVLQNRGNGIFATKVDYTVGSGPYSVALGDVNGDGKADIVTANLSDTDTSVIFNTAKTILYASSGTGGTVGIGTATPGSKLSVSGAVLINNRGNIGNTSADAGLALEVVGTMSGSTVYAKDALRSSGSLVFEGAASGSSLYLGTSLQGAGLTSCNNSTTSKLLYNSTTGRFGCGTDQDTGGGGGLSIASGDERYVKKQGDTMTGSLVVEGDLTFGNAISDAITVNAGSWTFANDTNFALSGGVNGLSFDTDTLSVDALNNRIGINTTAPKTRLEVVGTISGSLIRASNMTVSGAIVYSSGNTLMQNAKGQSGQLLIAQGTNAPQWKDPGGGMIWYFDGTQAVTTMKGPQITMPMALTLSGISLKAKGAPTGAALIYDINKDGVSIFSTRPQIDAAAITGGSNAVFSTTVLPADSVLTIDIDQVGSTFAGSGVTIILKGIRRY